MHAAMRQCIALRAVPSSRRRFIVQIIPRLKSGGRLYKAISEPRERAGLQERVEPRELERERAGPPVWALQQV